MAQILGFDKSYSGLNENDAWRKIYEFGSNLMPIKTHTLQKKYNKIFNKKTKVIRSNTLQKVSTDRLVPGDIFVLEKGDFVPADCKVLEENSLKFDVNFLPQDKEFGSDFNEKIVYQGMKVKNGRAVVEAIRTADTTYLGSMVKKIDTKNIYESRFINAIHKYFNIIGSLGIILLVFGVIFSFVTKEGNFVNKLSISMSSGLLLFLATLPIGSILVFITKFIEQRNIIKKSNLTIKKHSTLLKAHKTSVICLDESFLQRNYEKYIQRFYKAGIMISVISELDEEKILELAKKAGIIENHTSCISGNEIDKMTDEQLEQAVCNSIIFCQINNLQKLKIIETFNKLNIKTIAFMEGIQDLPLVCSADISICTHKRKNNLEYEFSDAVISGDEITSIYSLIKGSGITKKYLSFYMKYYIMFQLPVIVSLLVGLLAGVNLSSFFFQTIIFIVAIIPLMLLLVNRDYSEEKIFELREEDKAFTISCVKFGFIGLITAIIGMLLYILLSIFNFDDALKISIMTILFTMIDAIIVIISRKKAINKTEIKEEVKQEKKSTNVEKKEEKSKKIVKEKKIKQSQKSAKKKNNIEDIKDQIM